MFGEPAFVSGQNAAKAESEALLAEQRVAAVARAVGHDGVTVGDVRNDRLFGVARPVAHQRSCNNLPCMKQQQTSQKLTDQVHVKTQAQLIHAFRVNSIFDQFRLAFTGTSGQQHLATFLRCVSFKSFKSVGKWCLSKWSGHVNRKASSGHWLPLRTSR